MTRIYRFIIYIGHIMINILHFCAFKNKREFGISAQMPDLVILKITKVSQVLYDFMLHFRLLCIMFYSFQLDLFYFIGLVSDNECMYRNVLVRPRILLATLFIVRFHNRNAKTDIMML